MNTVMVSFYVMVTLWPHILQHIDSAVFKLLSYKNINDFFCNFFYIYNLLLPTNAINGIMIAQCYTIGFYTCLDFFGRNTILYTYIFYFLTMKCKHKLTVNHMETHYGYLTFCLIKNELK